MDTDRLIGLASALVAIDTSNPPGDEEATRDVLKEALKHWGPEWTEVEPAPGRLSLIGRLSPPDQPGNRRPILIVNGHTDVVPALAANWTHHPFQPQVRAGRLYGRGAADMKGGVAAAIRALDTLEAAGRARACEIVFQFVADEEKGGGLGTRALLKAGHLKGDACLVPEPTSLSVCVAERGLLQGHVVIHGRPAHGSRPREGVSAVEHAARVALALHAADFGDPAHQLLGTPTANVGTLHGGTTVNVVAEEARVGFDRRLLPGVSLEQATAGLRKHIEALGVHGLDYEIEVDDFGEGSEMPADQPFAELVRKAVMTATGREPATIGMTFTTDARFLRNQAGIPAVVCGPGSISQAHGTDEWVSVDQLVEATVAYAELYASFGTGTPAPVTSDHLVQHFSQRCRLA
ncbi:MAG TPA: M20 family metallopeptidase [Acidimicrobiales bacterium]|nr:M20 family metallopeptidase [Acidimicrobiales bacterium]